MNKEFIPYEQALELKQLGFDEPCIAVTHRDETLMSITHQMTGRDTQVETFATIINSECTWEDDEESVNGIQEVATPTYSQCFRWFREVYELYPIIELNIDKKWFFSICKVNGTCEIVTSHLNYEEAELACLKKLIELVKQKL